MKTVELTETEWLNIRSALLTRAEEMCRGNSNLSLANKYREIEDKIDKQTSKQSTNQE